MPKYELHFAVLKEDEETEKRVVDLPDDAIPLSEGQVEQWRKVFDIRPGFKKDTPGVWYLLPEKKKERTVTTSGYQTA